MELSNNKHHKIIFTIISAVVVLDMLVFGVVWIGSKIKSANSVPRKFSSENVLYTKLADKNSLPNNFPKNTPVEVNMIKNVEVLNYPDRKVEVINISYVSNKQQEELSTIYDNYFKQERYTITNSSKKIEHSIFEAKKDNLEFDVNINPGVNNINVIVSYIVRS